MMIKLLPKVLGLLLLFSFAAHSATATPGFFLDQVYQALDQLDQALESGDIDYSDYETLVESFIMSPFGDIEADQETILKGADSLADVATGVRLRYRGSVAQKLGVDRGYTRYHRMSANLRMVSLDLSVEQRNPGETLVRSRSVAFKHARGQVILGSYNLKIGNGLTVGNGRYVSELRRRDHFGSSLVQPVMNHENGLLVRQKISLCDGTLFVSRIEGDEFYNLVYGSALEFRTRRQNLGVVFIGQQLGQFHGSRQVDNYLAPFVSLSSGGLKFVGESSFGLRAAVAHWYQLEVRNQNTRHEAAFFSYGQDYHNLQSGGYAYSDYRQTRIDEIGLTYSDKRSGRVGASLSSRAEFADQAVIGATFVRWQDRIDGRQCAAAMLNLADKTLARNSLSISVRAIWEDFDLERHSNNRRLVSVTTGWKLTPRLTLESNHKIERRLRSGRILYPFRTRFDFQWAITKAIFGTATLDYHDSDLRVGNDRTLGISVGQKITRSRFFSFWIKGQTRYWVDRQVARDWELRVYCDLAA
jgi:hypothetical protein